MRKNASNPRFAVPVFGRAAWRLPGERQTFHATGAGAPKKPRARGQGGARGAHVINEENALISRRKSRFSRAERAVGVPEAVRTGQMRLRAAAPAPGQTVQDHRALPIVRERAGQFFRGAISAIEPAGKRRRDRHDRVDPRRHPGETIREHPAQSAGKMKFPPVFEAQNRLADRPLQKIPAMEIDQGPRRRHRGRRSEPRAAARAEGRNVPRVKILAAAPAHAGKHRVQNRIEETNQHNLTMLKPPRNPKNTYPRRTSGSRRSTCHRSVLYERLRPGPRPTPGKRLIKAGLTTSL